MENQVSNRVLMVRPATFYFNAETAENNSFQIVPSKEVDKLDIHAKAAFEFDSLVKLLRKEGVIVEVILEEPEPFTPDSVFPNNWISFHSENDSGVTLEGGANREQFTAVLYPMWSEKRQIERRKLAASALALLPKETTVLDLSPLENSRVFLEGTGSMVLDRANRVAYTCLSPRTTKSGVNLFCKRMGYREVCFNGIDSTGKPCYHTNVLMSIADKYCLICLDSITDLAERVEVEVSLKTCGKVVIPLGLDQMSEFAGNCLQLRGAQGTFLVMSSRAYKSLTEEQIETICQFDKIFYADVETIENLGGGSVRCMIAEMGEVKDPAQTL